MDHVTNSVLYRKSADSDDFVYVGDARTASQAAGNWFAAETAEKFHTRPTWHEGRVYVASLDYSSIYDDGYLQRRGFHWYCYDESTGEFIDLSAAEPGGTALEHGGLATVMFDPTGPYLYGAEVPRGRLVRYDMATGRTTDLGRPPSFNQPYVYITRFLWQGRDGKVYLTAGNSSYRRPDDPAVFRHVHYYDPVTDQFGQRTDWPLRSTTAIETGQWTLDGTLCYMADDSSNFYRYDAEANTFAWLAKMHTGLGKKNVFHLSASGKKIYTMNQDYSPITLVEFDIASRMSQTLMADGAIDDAVATGVRHTGFGTWDAEGRFYFVSFTTDPNVVVTAVDPVRLKVALGLLPELVAVTIEQSGSGADALIVRRTGSTAAALSVILSVVGAQERMVTAIMPAGRNSVVVNPDLPDGAVRITVLPDGDTYVAGAQRTVSVNETVATVNRRPPVKNETAVVPGCRMYDMQGRLLGAREIAGRAFILEITPRMARVRFSGCTLAR